VHDAAQVDRERGRAGGARWVVLEQAPILRHEEVGQGGFCVLQEWRVCTRIKESKKG